MDDIRATIATYGWMVMRIDEDDQGPGFAYTIGLEQSFAHPEVIVVGLRMDTAQTVLNNVGADIRGGAAYAAGLIYTDILDAYSVTFRRVPEYQYAAYLGAARRYYAERAFRALQLIYPSRDGRWPWDTEAAEAFREAQPVLADTPLPDWAS